MAQRDGTDDRMQRFSGRQITIIVVAVCLTVVATPFAALAASASFSSNSASTPAVSARNTASGSGAKAVLGNATATSGTVYGVYGHAGSAQGYGVYSSGRLGTSGRLVCSQCVTAADVDTAGFPTVPDASKLGGHTPSYYARVAPLSAIVPGNGQDQVLADIDGITIVGNCVSVPQVSLGFRADSTADDGTLNYFEVNHNASVVASGSPLSTGTVYLPSANAFEAQTEGTAIYRNSTTGRVITVNFHLYAQNCEVFGQATTAG